MKKTIQKFLFLATACLLSNNLFALETICYKNGVDLPSTIETVGLDGDLCKGKLSVNDMKNSGWEILDIKITSTQNKFDYSYYFYKAENQNSYGTSSSLTNEKPLVTNFSVKPIGIKLGSIENNKTTINTGNLVVGQSGIVVHIFDNDKKLVVANAKVISSNDSSSVVEFVSFDDLKQNAIPTSKRKPVTGDVLVLNYMYNSSLAITPTYNAFQGLKDNFRASNFLHPDVFAAKLKVTNNPYPTKEDIQQFAIEQNLGTIFFVLEGKVYVLDTKTFTVLAQYPYSYDSKDTQRPFFTRVEEIEESIFNLSYFAFLSDKKTISYDEYYKRILGLSK